MNQSPAAPAIAFAAVAARLRRATADGLLRGPALTNCLAEFQRRAGRKPRGCAYIDGLNFYRRAVDGTKYKWLELRGWARLALPPDCDIAAVHYFTSEVLGGLDPDSPGRQNSYLRALADRGEPVAAPEFHIHLGAFIRETKSGRPVGHFWAEDFCRQAGRWLRAAWAWLRRRPRPVAAKAGVNLPVEKGTDVNLAVQMALDAAADRFDFAVLVSTDSDFVGLCRTVREQFGKGVFLAVTPQMDRGRAERKRGVAALKSAADGIIHILPKHLAAAQMPQKFRGRNGAVHEAPPEWR